MDLGEDLLGDTEQLDQRGRLGEELAAEGRIQGQADYAYSFMGYQGFPADLAGWRETYGPQVAEKLTAEKVDCVLLTAA